jgi:transcriptional regulator with XRE-family HTH domain
VILERMAQVRRMRAQHLTQTEIARQLGVDQTTISHDEAHLRELALADEADGRQIAISNLQVQAQEQRAEIVRIRDMLASTTERSLNVSGLVGQIQAARRELHSIEMDIAKLRGALAPAAQVSGKVEGAGEEVRFTLRFDGGD